jgi:hypothetical protein
MDQFVHILRRHICMIDISFYQPLLCLPAQFLRGVWFAFIFSILRQQHLFCLG